MFKPLVSLILPSIRTHNLVPFYESAKLSCKQYPFEIVVVSPFSIPKELQNNEQIVYVRDYGSPSRATQIAVLHATGKYIYNCVDDGLFVESSIDLALGVMEQTKNNKIIMNMRYTEMQGRIGHALPESFWFADFHSDLHNLDGIRDKGYKISMHWLMRRDYYMALGGVDCDFEYVNHGSHDLMFRAQADGAFVMQSPKEGLLCDHMPGKTGDHGPIHDAQTGHDQLIFEALYGEEKDVAKGRIHIDFDNWRQQPTVWERRFDPDNLPTTYEKMLNG